MRHSKVMMTDDDMRLFAEWKRAKRNTHDAAHGEQGDQIESVLADLRNMQVGQK